MSRSHAIARLTIGICLLSPVASAIGQSVSLVAERTTDQAVRVEAVYEVAGELKFRADQEVKTLPTSATAKLAYDELLLPSAGPARSLRFYRTAEANIRVEKTDIAAKLRDERRLLIAEQTDAQPQLFCPDGCLTSDEAELVQLPATSLLVDNLLPNKDVKIGESWKHDAEVFVALLNLDAVSHCEVSSTLTESDEAAARIEINGTVQGALGGVAAEFDVAGRYKFDRRLGRVTWLGWVVKEKRSIGHVEPGVDMTSRLQMRMEPIATPTELDVAQLPKDALATIPELLRLDFQSLRGGYRFEHDRRWHVMADRTDVVSLRLVDRGDLVAQCNVTSVALPDPNKQPELAQFQEDIRRSLGKNFGQFTKVGDSDNSLGYKIFRAEAIGTVEELEIVWKYFLIQDRQGRQVVMAFTCEQPMVERFADADQALVDTLRFLEAQSAAEPTPAPLLR